MSGTIAQIIVSFGVGLIVLAVGLKTKKVRKHVAILMAVGFGLLLFVLWPRATLVGVPDISHLSRDEAELRLFAMKLVGVPQPQEAPTTRPEHVIPGSQNPLPGTRVRRGSLVRYSISTTPPEGSGDRLNADDPANSQQVSILSPREGGDVAPRRGADNKFRFDVEGTIQGVDLSKFTLLLWVQPIKPPSDQPGWYLQRLPANGVRSISGNAWRGVCQLGNQQYPPHDGDLVEVAASLVPAEEATRLDARQGPMATVVLPGVVSEVVRLTVRLK
jgi:hypothetical protein